MFHANHGSMGFDANQFTELIRQHRGLIHKVTLAYCVDPSDREDVAQEIVVQLWRSRDKYDERFRTTTWIYRIALNVAISFYRRERRHRIGRQPLDEQLLRTVGAAEPEVSYDVQRLLRCINTLGAIEKGLVLLYLDGHDHAAIADVLGTSTSNVGTKLSRVKSKLRTCLTGATPDTPKGEL
jgi:RNA polymerase sigma factor (sigma-70 family)